MFTTAKNMILASAVVVLFYSAALCEDNPDELAGYCRKIAGQFGTELKKELNKAMRNQGPADAIFVCAEIAPEIARKYSDDQGLRVGRTSLKIRNPENAPDTWESDVLMQFEQRAETGEPLENMEHHAVVKKDGRPYFRYMKAIPARSMCLVCHGTDIPEEVQKALDKMYPGDKAHGFEAGDLRGAFTIFRPLQP